MPSRLASLYASSELVRRHGGNGAPDAGVGKRRLEVGSVTPRHIPKRTEATVEVVNVSYIRNTHGMVTVVMSPPREGSVKRSQRQPTNRTETEAQSEPQTSEAEAEEGDEGRPPHGAPTRDSAHGHQHQRLPHQHQRP